MYDHVTQNKSLSSNSDDILEILRLQGVGWFTRQAIVMATLYLSVEHSKGDDGVEHIDIEQTLTGGIKGTNEHRILDWTEREHEDYVFGSVLSKSQRVALDDVEQEWLRKDWLDDSFDDGKTIYTVAESNTEKSGRSWKGEQVSVFAHDVRGLI